MRSDAEGVLEATMAAYAICDLEAAAVYFDEAVIYAIYIDQEILPFGGEVVGRDAVMAVWRDIHRSFELLRYEPKVTTCQDDVVRVQIQFAFRHRRSNAVIDGVMRQVVEVKNGKIARLREYHDQERIRAFMQLYAQDSDDLSAK